MKKKVLSVLLATTLVVSMTGCGDSSSTSGSSDSEKTEESGSADAGSDEEEAITTTLTVWAPSEDQDAEQGQWLQTMCEQFNEAHPNWDITFQYDVCAEGDAKTTVTQDVEAAADVYMYANDNLPDLVAANAIAKLGGDTLEYVTTTNSQSMVDSVTYNDGVYGVPFTSNTWYMYYDKSVYSEDDIKSLDTMLEKGKVSFPLNNSWYIASFYTANGCTLFGDGTDEEAGIDFGGDKGTAVTNYLVDLVDNSNFVNDKDGAGLAGLADGSVNAMFSGSWDYADVKKALGDNVGVAALPCITIDGQECQMKSFSSSKAIGVNPNSEYPQVAVALAAYLGGEEAQMAHYETRGIIPSNTALAEDATIAADPVAVAQNATIETTSILQPVLTAMNDYWTPAENFGNALLNGDVTHSNAADQTEEFNTSMNTSVAE